MVEGIEGMTYEDQLLILSLFSLGKEKTEG